MPTHEQELALQLAQMLVRIDALKFELAEARARIAQRDENARIARRRVARVGAREPQQRRTLGRAHRHFGRHQVARQLFAAMKA